eukprot:scaffold14674_cov24-Cyclotella_meneghiniana.AAC.2
MSFSSLRHTDGMGFKGQFIAVSLLGKNALLTNLRKVSHMGPVGGGWRGHRRRDLALHRPSNLVGSIYLPHNVDSSAIVITRILPISVVPSVLGMINDDDALYRQSAIFRLLKSIPDLCNVGSRMKIVSNDDDDDDDIDAVKDGACGNKRRKKT